MWHMVLMWYLQGVISAMKSYLIYHKINICYYANCLDVLYFQLQMINHHITIASWIVQLGFSCLACELWWNSVICHKFTWCFFVILLNIISYPLFADADTGIYPHAASQYHTRPKAKRGIVMLSVDKFPYPRKQTRGNEFIPCSNNTCYILKRFRSFKIPAITLIWPKSSYKHSVTR